MATNIKNTELTKREINLKLTLSDINIILIALGNLPYNQVHLLVEDIRVQTEVNLATNRSSSDKESNNYEHSKTNS